MLDCWGYKRVIWSHGFIGCGNSSDISNVSSAQPSHRSWRSRSPLTAAVSPLLQVFSCYQPVLCVCPNWRGDCRDGIVIPATVSRNVACKAVMTSVHCSRRLTFWKLLSCLVTIQWVSSSLLLRCTTCPEFADLLLLCIVSGEEAWIRPSGAITEVTIHKDDQLLLVTSRPHRSGRWRHLPGTLATK